MEWWRLGAIGLTAGLLSGLLGIGGGILMVPAFVGWVRLPIKEAVGCSLACVGILAVPGTITHALLGHIDWAFALPLCVAVIPGRACRRASRDPVVGPRRCGSPSQSCSVRLRSSTRPERSSPSCELPGPNEDGVEHRFGELARERVLLARMEAARGSSLATSGSRRDGRSAGAVGERDAGVAQRGPERLVPERAESHDRPPPDRGA